jgi:hypothetical protein
MVNASDLALLKDAMANPGSPDVADFEYDGKPGIDREDIARFFKRSHRSLDPPAKPLPRFRGRGVQKHDVASTRTALRHRVRVS